jgi:hypothetical protein
MHKKIIIAALIIGCVYSCKNGDPSLKEALRFAGNNESELQKVLEHYSKPSDSLKLRAARFLITNMPYQFGYYGREIDTFSAIFSVIDTLSYVRQTLTNEDKLHICDSFVTRHGWPKAENADKIYDSKIISANYLIKDIDFAFNAWKRAPWGKQVSFEDFCEYILPYRIRKERAECWRPWFYRKYERMAAGCSKPGDARSVFDNMNWNLNTATSFNLLINKYYPFNQSIGDVVKGRIGSCEMTSFFAASAMRAVGLPVGYDYIMHWGSGNNRHCLPHLVGHFDTLSLITNENVQKDTWHLVDFSSEFNTNRHLFLPGEVPKGLYIQNVITIPKVYRFTYSQSAMLLNINRQVPQDFISPEFRQTNLKDVTKEYITTADVRLPLDSSYNKYKVAYLCVFDPVGWQPVAITSISMGHILFEAVGKNIVYLPTVFHDGMHWPVGAPFYVDADRRMHTIEVNMEKNQNVRLLRKYPLYTYTAYHTEILKGGRFEASNDPGFKKTTVLYTIPNYPFFVNTVPSRSAGKFRYFRYVAPDSAKFEPDNIAEVQFLDEQGKVLKGLPLGIDGIPGHEIDKAFDNDLASYYQNSRNRNGWIGIDLGPGVSRRVRSIRFCPRNDTNGIIPGNEYELFFWDGAGWASLGIKVANDYSLNYRDIPSNGLYWLRCNSGGSEERMFTYINGMQVWW